ncbi:MAG: HU family DNA-binding protein [Clostridia bacterium]|jgi:DNA-binding protein HU-beta|nr:HU family DNA-binding protein [Clostridia bacterium]
MTKKELIAVAAKNAGISQKAAAAVVDDIFNSIANELTSGQDVTLTGFGSFKVKTRAARSGRNPRTKETVEIPESKVIVFKPSTTLKDSVNK